MGLGHLLGAKKGQRLGFCFGKNRFGRQTSWRGAVLQLEGARTSFVLRWDIGEFPVAVALLQVPAPQRVQQLLLLVSHQVALAQIVANQLVLVLVFLLELFPSPHPHFCQFLVFDYSIADTTRVADLQPQSTRLIISSSSLSWPPSSSSALPW